jgi:alpha-galactosidase
MNFSVVMNENTQNTKVALTQRQKEDGILLVDVDVTYAEPQVPTPFSVCFETPCIDMYSTWGAYIGFQRTLNPSWSKTVTKSRLASGAPLHQTISSDDQNGITIALSDAMMPIDIATGVSEETSDLRCEIRFFTMPVNTLSEYHATIYIDQKRRPYGESLMAAEHYWAEECGYPCAYIPDSARRPMYSCWYSFHQNIDVEAIIDQCRIAKEYGMESVIVDDGWQVANGERGYAYCGDWEVIPSKVPDMKQFVDRVHELGMKFILWYSVPHVGKYSKAIDRFSDMLLGYPPKHRSYACLDPRFPEVREYLINIYRDAVKNWGLDGLKLDFIDSFKIYPDTPAFDERWDTRSVEEAVDRLLRETTDALRAINPNIMIEFRQSYFGPTIRKYGNMIRVRDCPNDSFMNHVFGTDLRFTLGTTPAHSDMLTWHTDDSVEAAAYQMACILFTVPQISLLLDKLPDDHKKMLKFYLGFWNQNREVLLDGNFSAENPESLYSLVKSEKDGHTIAVAHAKPILTVSSIGKLHFVNASNEKALVLRTATDLGKHPYRIFDCTGNITEQGERDLSRGLHEFSVPRCGIVEVL